MASKKKTARRTTRTRAKAKTAPAKRASASRKTAAKGTAQTGLALTAAAPSFTVNDVEKSLAWYRDVLGFKVGERWEEEGKLSGVEMRAGRVTFMLGQDDWKKGRDRSKGEGLRLYCDTTQDVDGIAARIKANGGTLAEEPFEGPWGARALTVDDPDGFRITISKRR